MTLFNLFFNNLLTLPVLAFLLGIIFSQTRLRETLKAMSFKLSKVSSLLTYFLLFAIGLKGGLSLIEHYSHRVFLILSLLALVGLLQPLICYGLLRRFTNVDSATAAAISACFGSISVMTYIAATTFLEDLNVPYNHIVMAALAIMEVPAIISGLLISKIFVGQSKKTIKHLLIESFLNKSIIALFIGLFIGAISYLLNLTAISSSVLLLFKPALIFFLFNMGLSIRNNQDSTIPFSWSLSLFGIYMPLIGASFGLLFSYCFGLNVGTGTLIAVLTASASYIAAPAAMKLALPEAKENIYLPLSLGITFPFNVIIGIPLYYQGALYFLR